MRSIVEHITKSKTNAHFVTDTEDNLLMQIVYQFAREGLRVTWSYVAQRMYTRRSFNKLRVRIASLKRTYGKLLQNFPLCFFASAEAKESAPC
eukprot:jgi/Phyca11/106714/e_gw1.12.687.1